MHSDFLQRHAHHLGCGLGRASMLDYRIYLLDEEGRVGQVPEVIRSASDEDATRRARRLQGSLAAEVLYMGHP